MSAQSLPASLNWLLTTGHSSATLSHHVPPNYRLTTCVHAGCVTEQLPVGFTAVLVHVREIHTPRQPGVQRRLTSIQGKNVALLLLESWASSIYGCTGTHRTYPWRIYLARAAGWMFVRIRGAPLGQVVFHAQVVRSLRLFKTSLHPQAYFLAMPAFMRLRCAVVNALQ